MRLLAVTSLLILFTAACERKATTKGEAPSVERRSEPKTDERSLDEEDEDDDRDEDDDVE